MLKKAVIALTVSSLSTACIPFVNGVPSLDGVKSNNKNFSIKSTTNATEIKKSFLPITRITKLKKKDDEEKWKKYSFTATNEDLKRRFILNIINGSNNGERVGNLEVRLNRVSIITNHDEYLNETDDISKIKKKLCKENENENEHKNYSKDSGKDDSDKKFKIKHDNDDKKEIKDCTTIISNFFNRKTESLSVSLFGIKEGLNTLEVRVKDERKNYSLDISIDGFLKPINIPNAIHSLIADNAEIRKAPYVKGRVGIKFLEGMKIRLETQADGTKKLVDLNGTNLTSINRVIKSFNAKDVYNPFGTNIAELEKEEIDAEIFWGKDTPNPNSFYYLEVDETSDIWSMVDELRKIPFIEEAFPEILESPNSVEDNPLLTEPQLNYRDNLRIPNHLGNRNSKEKLTNTWLRITNILDNLNFDEELLTLQKEDGTPITDEQIDKAVKHLLTEKDEFGNKQYEPGAYRFTLGSENIKVAVIEGGFQVRGINPITQTHEDLVGIKLETYDNISKELSSSIMYPRK